MSLQAERYQDRCGKRCECGKIALTSVRGMKHKWLSDHDLCWSCFRDLLNANRTHRSPARAPGKYGPTIIGPWTEQLDSEGRVVRESSVAGKESDR